MVCAVLPAQDAGCALGPWMAVDQHANKRSTSSFNEIGNLWHTSVQKKIRTSLEPMPLLVAAHKQRQGHISSQYTTCAQLEAQQFAQQSAGRCQTSIQQAFYLWSDCEVEFLQSCLAKETKSQPSAQYFGTTQQEIDAHKRLVLVDWLIEVVDEFGLGQETLYLAISLLDRFLSLQAVPRCQLQLLGVTCLWVASKYEEVLPPVLQDFVDITDNSYAPCDLVRMEALLLERLQYELAVPTPLHFLHQLLSHAQLESGAASPCSPTQPECPSEARLAHLAEYLLELALLTPDTLRYRPSVVAASALQLASSLLAGSSPPSSRAACSNLCRAISVATATQLDGCMEELRTMHRWAGSAVSPPCVRDKYSEGRHSCVAALQLPAW